MSDVMLYGVLCMPYEMAMGSEMSRYQFYQRVQEAASRLEVAESELAALKAQPAPTEVQGEDSARLDAEIEVSYELVQDDMIVAGASGLGAERDIAHYALVYGQDGPLECYRVERQKFNPFARASAETGGVKS